MIHLTFGRLELGDVSRQVGVTIVGRLPAQLNRATGLVNNLETVRRFGFLLDDQVDARVITSERVGRDASEERRVLSLCPLDADCAEHTIRLAFLPDGVSGIDVGVQPLVIHIP